MTPLIIILLYLGLLLGLGLLSNRFYRGTARDYFVASHSIGPFLLLMSVFGTTMTAFALVGSTGKAFQKGIGVYGLMASWSGLIHTAVFFLIGIKLWAIGKRWGYVTQIQYFRDRFESQAVGYLLFPILVGLVIPYLLMGLIGAGRVITPVTAGAFPELFPHDDARLVGGIPPWLTCLVICSVVLSYVFAGGLRGAAWANTFQTLVFMAMGLVAFFLIAKNLGGFAAATANALPESLVRAPSELTITPRKGAPFIREMGVGKFTFLTYCFVPLSVGMFPHLFQHWLTAKSAKTFRLTVIAHPICIMIVWVPCVLIGIWATGVLQLPDERANAVLGIMVGQLGNPVIMGLLTAGILAAIMSSLDSQFLCLGTMFTHDVVIHHFGEERFSDRQRVTIARGFIVLIVAFTYVLSLFDPPQVFDLGIWCFSGFASLFPIVVASIYWRGVTKIGVLASVVVTAVVWFWLFARSGFGGDMVLAGGVMPVTAIFTASAVTLIAVSWVTKGPSAATLKKFFPEQPERVAVRAGAMRDQLRHS